MWTIQVLVITGAVLASSYPQPSPFQIFRRHSIPGLNPFLESRQGRNSKLMNFGRSMDIPASPLSLVEAETSTGTAEADVAEDATSAPPAQQEVKLEASEDSTEAAAEEAVEPRKEAVQAESQAKEEVASHVEDVITEKLMDNLLQEIIAEDQEDRHGKDGEDKLGIHNFDMSEEERTGQVAGPVPVVGQLKPQQFQLGQQELFPEQQQLAYQQQQQQVYQLPQQPAYQQQQAVYQQQQPYQQQFLQPQQQPAYHQFQQHQINNLKQLSSSSLQARSGLLTSFGATMGESAVGNPEDNDYASYPQLDQRQVSVPASGADEDVRCINKVMQVEETVFDERIKCQHTFTEKCHETYITDYVPTQEKKCETSFEKNCHITYKPMVFEETVEVCKQPLVKTCSNGTVGEEVCTTQYETNCETRYKEHIVEQDEPVCEMVTERRCNGVNVPIPADETSNDLVPEELKFRRRRQEDTTLQPEIQIGGLNTTDSVNVGIDCEEWPIQKCRLEKKVVKKNNPETSCRKIPREICAPSNCAFQKSEQLCHEEKRNLVQNIPDEECGLEPKESCKMETVLVPRLIQKPNCVKVPKEVCVNAKTNPRKVKKPVIKEWCYKPSDLKNSSSRLALSQFFAN